MPDLPDNYLGVERSPRKYEENTLHAAAGIGLTIQPNSYKDIKLGVVSYDIIIAYKYLMTWLYSSSNDILNNYSYTIVWGISPDETPSAIYWIGEKRAWNDELIRITQHDCLYIRKPQCFWIRIHNNTNMTLYVSFMITGIRYDIK